MGRHRAVDGSLELLDLAARDVFEPAAHSLGRVGLLALGLLGQLAFPASEPSLEVVKRTAAFGRVRLRSEMSSNPLRTRWAASASSRWACSASSRSRRASRVSRS